MKFIIKEVRIIRNIIATHYYFFNNLLTERKPSNVCVKNISNMVHSFPNYIWQLFTKYARQWVFISINGVSLKNCAPPSVLITHKLQYNATFLLPRPQHLLFSSLSIIRRLKHLDNCCINESTLFWSCVLAASLLIMLHFVWLQWHRWENKSNQDENHKMNLQRHLQEQNLFYNCVNCIGICSRWLISTIM